MNKDNFLSLLKKYFANIRVHSDVLNELCDIFAKSGRELKFITLLVARLATLLRLGALAANEPEFESLGDGLFSMHFAASGFNVRILYAFLPNREPVLLLAFYEREGKNMTDYSKKLSPAKERFHLLKEEYENESYRR